MLSEAVQFRSPKYGDLAVYNYTNKATGVTPEIQGNPNRYMSEFNLI